MKICDSGNVDSNDYFVLKCRYVMMMLIPLIVCSEMKIHDISLVDTSVCSVPYSCMLLIWNVYFLKKGNLVAVFVHCNVFLGARNVTLACWPGSHSFKTTLSQGFPDHRLGLPGSPS